jgi:hypothetical protein
MFRNAFEDNGRHELRVAEKFNEYYCHFFQHTKL